MKRPLIYDLATQWHSNRFPLMAGYYLPYKADSSSRLSPGKVLAGGRVGPPALSHDGKVSPSPVPWPVGAGDRLDAHHAGLSGKAAASPCFGGLGTHLLSGGTCCPSLWDFNSVFLCRGNAKSEAGLATFSWEQRDQGHIRMRVCWVVGTCPAPRPFPVRRGWSRGVITC